MECLRDFEAEFKLRKDSMAVCVAARVNFRESWSDGSPFSTKGIVLECSVAASSLERFSCRGSADRFRSTGLIVSVHLAAACPLDVVSILAPGRLEGNTQPDFTSEYDHEL